MTDNDAYMFPVFASVFLFGLYVVFKLFSKEYVNMLLSTYVLIVSLAAVYNTIKPLFKAYLDPSWDSDPVDISIPIPVVGEKHFSLSNLDLVVLSTVALVGAWYLSSKHWIANNILGLSLSFQGVSRFPVGSYKVASILLIGLFFYDIFWVFGTDVMVTVAKSFDAPIKVMFPKSLFVADSGFSMLGLGDIVLPGIFDSLF